jgi:predicted  nucleic acid-binding Zn-ribbon protein
LTAQSDQRVQAAIAASARAEASLSGLFRAIQHLGSGVGGAREANELLTQELEALRDMLGAANEQQLAFKVKVAALEQALDHARKEAERERAFLTEQHDAFIVDLMDEQEGELERRDRDLDVLRERLSEIERRNTMPTVPPPTVDTRGSSGMKAAPNVEDEGSTLDRAERVELERTAQKLAEDRERARETVQRLQAQRDEAHGAVARITKERDEALQQINRLKSELGGPRIPLSTRPPTVESRRGDAISSRLPSVAGKVPGIELTLDNLEIDQRLSRPPVSAPQLNVPPVSTPQLASPISSLPPPQISAQRPTAPAPAISNIPTPRSNPMAAPPPPRLSPPPDEMRLALTASPALQPLGASSRPPLKQKPDVSTRPLVGYSLNDEHVEAEQIEGVRLSKPPPSRDKR